MASHTFQNVCSGPTCLIFPQHKNDYRPYFLRHPVLYFLSGLLIIGKALPALLLTLTPQTAVLSTITPSFVIDQTNAARREAGLPPLHNHPALAKAAKLKAEDMLKYDYFAHTSPDGATPWQWFKQAGYNYVYAGENLAIDFNTGEAMYQAWMQSPGHRKNILSNRYRDIGVAVINGEYNGRTTSVVAVHFGSLSRDLVKSTVSENTPLIEDISEPKRSETLESPAPTSTPVPATPPPPQIIEPGEGQLLTGGAATVRGTAKDESNVNVILDEASVGNYPAPEGIFEGSFTPPANQERAAVLKAQAEYKGRRGPYSEPVSVNIDTKGPQIKSDKVMFLPDPEGLASTALLLVPVSEDTAKAVAQIKGKKIDLEVDGMVATARVSSHTAGQNISLQAVDNHGNVTSAEATPVRQFHSNPKSATEAQALKKASFFAQSTNSVLIFLITSLALLLAINIFTHIKIQRADLIAHALFVIILGTLLLSLT